MQHYFTLILSGGPCLIWNIISGLIRQKKKKEERELQWEFSIG